MLDGVHWYTDRTIILSRLMVVKTYGPSKATKTNREKSNVNFEQVMAERMR